jgi:hypothetical protein
MCCINIILNTFAQQTIITDSNTTELNTITVKALRASNNAPFTKTEITQTQIAKINCSVFMVLSVVLKLSGTIHFLIAGNLLMVKFWQ